MTGPEEFGVGDDFDDDFFELSEEEYQKQEEDFRQQAEQEAIADPSLDYYEKVIPELPKREIGEYVSSQGFKAPYISEHSEWVDAFDNDVAMIRSDLEQDYKGYSGLLRSTVIKKELLLPFLSFSKISPSFHENLRNLAYGGLRSVDLGISEYMKLFEWPAYKDNLYRELGYLGVEPILDYNETASHWRYIHGTNIRIFRDPSVDGRYHLGLKPDYGYVMGYEVNKEDYSKNIKQEQSDSEVNPQQIIDFYEAVRNLPRFDNRQAPLMELQLNEAGDLHFLQYLKTGHVVESVEEFALPEGKHITRAIAARGATKPDGQDIKIYIAPKKVTKQMHGQAFYFDTMQPRGFAQQYLSMIGNMVVHAAYVSLKDNHFSSAPLVRPQVCINLLSRRNPELNKKLGELTELVHGRSVYDKTPNHSVYIDAHITANGREATIETDWSPKFEETLVDKQELGVAGKLCF